MTTMTIEQVAAEHARLGAIIAALQTPAPKLLLIREAQIEMRPGERYAGTVLDDDGLISHHLVLLPGEAEALTWQGAKDWASEVGGELPTRQEQALLYANLKSDFKPEWYWSSQAYESDISYAWITNFLIGDQDLDDSKSAEVRARAVRRFTA